jgi:glycosyltransferase involved in cell wall biosynthesis
MHIIHVTPRYFPNLGGVEAVVQKISETLAARNIKVTVYSVDFNPYLQKKQEINGVLVKRFAPLIGDPLYLPDPSFLWSLRREKAHIIHFHNIHTLLPFFAVLLKRKKQKLLLQPHYHRFGQSLPRHFLFSLYRHVLGNLIVSIMDAVIVNSFYENKIFHEDFKCKNTILIPEGVDTDKLERVKNKTDASKIILYVGALKKYKNVDKILESFTLLIKEGYSDYQLVIVGDGPEYASLVSQSLKMGIEPFIQWKCGLTQEELLREYARASIFVHLSPLESFSRVVYEALLAGVPAVVLNYGATAHLVKGGFAEGVNSLNPKEIAEAILRASSKKYERISDTSFTFLKWDEYVKRVINVYNHLVENY